MTIEELSAAWLEAKETERDAAERRRKIEDQMRQSLKIEESEERTVKQVAGSYVVKANCRVNRKIDPEHFLRLANDAKVDVSGFTRWKCELVMAEWKKQPAYVQQTLSNAITAEPGRATFSVELISE